MYEQYSVLARHYDKLMDADYDGITDFYTECFKRYNGEKTETVYDLCCGTGEITYRLAQRGYKVYGVDISCDMLACARSKFDSMNISSVSLSQCDICNFESEIKTDAAVCAFDGFNYITEKKSLYEAICNAYRHLNDGGLLIFDMNTPYKYKNIFSGNTFTYDYDTLFLSWQNELSDAGLCRFYLTFFEKNGKSWIRYDEEQKQRVYKDTTVKKMLSDAGFTLMGEYGDLSFSPVCADTQRYYFVAQKQKV